MTAGSPSLTCHLIQNISCTNIIIHDAIKQFRLSFLLKNGKVTLKWKVDKEGLH
jgi:hypothetical protein